MAEFPYLTKAQQEAWARILEWYAQDKRGDYFISGGTREYVKIDSYIIPGTKTIFRALVSKGLLVIVDHRRKMFVDHYAIHPDYLPAASGSAAEPEEPVEDDNKEQGTMTTVTEINGVPVYVYEDFESIRQSGAINMYDRVGFCRLATSEVEDWVRQDKNNYSKILSGYDEWLAWKETNAAASEPAAEPKREGAGVDAPRFNVGDKVITPSGKTRTIANVYPGRHNHKWAYSIILDSGEESYILFNDDDFEVVTSEEHAPVDDTRPTIAELDEAVSNVLSVPTTLTEARLIDSITEARMERDRARNEVDSLRGQLDALRVRVAEMEAELAGEAADLEATAVREAHLATRVDELEAENAGLYEQVEKLNDEAENMSAYIVRVEQARDFWKRKSNPTYDSLRAVSDKQDEVIAALETALDLEKNENEKLRAAVTDDKPETKPAQKLRVWFVANVPNELFTRPVNSIVEAVTMLEALTDYSLYLGDAAIYTSAGGLQVYEDGEWTEWYSEDGEDIDEYMDSLMD